MCVVFWVQVFGCNSSWEGIHAYVGEPEQPDMCLNFGCIICTFTRPFEFFVFIYVCDRTWGEGKKYFSGEIWVEVCGCYSRQ